MLRLQPTAFLVAALAIPAAAQTRDAPARVDWPSYYQPSVRYEGMTRAGRAAALATLAELEQIFRRIPELANPTEFVVRKSYQGGARPIPVPAGLVQYSVGIHLFGRYGPDRQVAVAGCTCLGATVNFYPNVARKDEQGRDLILEEEPGPTIPGPVTSSGSMPENGSGAVNVMFTRGGVYPWEPVSREAYLRALIYELEGANGAVPAASRKPTPIGDHFRAEIAAMSPEERAKPARVEKNGDLLPVDATNGVAVLTPKLDLWRPRRSPVEVHSISVSIGGTTGHEKAYDEVLIALRETFRKLDWAAIKRIVDNAP